MERSYFISTLLIYTLESIYITFVYKIVLFLDVWFMNNTLFIYISKSILLIIGIIFSVFLGPDEHLPFFECMVAVWPVTVRYFW
jgi:hypothetical protein